MTNMRKIPSDLNDREFPDWKPPYRIEVDYNNDFCAEGNRAGMGISAANDIFIISLVGEEYNFASGSGWGSRNLAFRFKTREEYDRAWKMLEMNPDLHLSGWYKYDQLSTRGTDWMEKKKE